MLFHDSASFAVSEPRLTLVVAVARNGVIGRDGRLPWRLASDMRRFRAATMGKPVLMGRRTWESLQQRPLPGRQNLVLSRDPNYVAEGGWLFTELEVALAAARAMALRTGAGEICVIGGVALFEAVLPRAQRIVLTEVDLAPEGDAVLALDVSGWREVSREPVSAGPHDDADFVVRTLER